jgi:hypothetical protein
MRALRIGAAGASGMRRACPVNGIAAAVRADAECGWIDSAILHFLLLNARLA